jgi:hypothetical protein
VVLDANVVDGARYALTMSLILIGLLHCGNDPV